MRKTSSVAGMAFLAKNNWRKIWPKNGLKWPKIVKIWPKNCLKLRSQSKIWRKIQKIGGYIVTSITSFFHVWGAFAQSGNILLLMTGSSFDNLHQSESFVDKIVSLVYIIVSA